MARTDEPPRYSDPTAYELTRLLSRLEAVIPPPDAAEASPLRKSSYERTKVAANLEHARTLLLRLEHTTAGTKIQPRKQVMQRDVLAKREVIKRLNERLYELGQLDRGDSSSDEDASGEDLLGDEDEGDQGVEVTKVTPASSEAPSDPSNTLLRPRRTAPPTSATDTDTATATTTGASTSSTLPQSETLLTHNRTEQESLTSSLVSMAEALKASSQRFASSLESEKETLGRAGEGLEQNVTGLEAAGKRMGTLRRMTEGRGWLGRMMMYAWIGGLMLLALFIVGFLPKLRF